MMKQREQFAVLVALSAVMGGLACSWTDKDSEEFYGMLIIGTVIGALFSIICIVVACLPLCAGIMKAQAKIVAGVVIAIGIFVCFIPAITGKAQADAAVNKMCERCEADVNHSGCSEVDKSDAKDAVGALGIIVAYVHGFGFMVVILGITAAALGCCICCKCCKMKDEDGGNQGAGGQPAVIGQPVGQPC
jgi:hypothetical protein